MIALKKLEKISPDNCFVAISRKAGAQIRQLPGFNNRGGDPAHDYLNLRNIVTAMVRIGVVDEFSIIQFDPPVQNRNGSGMLLAVFNLKTGVKNESMDYPVTFRCRLVTGSPKGNLPYTLILNRVKDMHASQLADSA